MTTQSKLYDGKAERCPGVQKESGRARRRPGPELLATWRNLRRAAEQGLITEDVITAWAGTMGEAEPDELVAEFWESKQRIARL